MGGLKGRLERLESRRGGRRCNMTSEALRLLSDEDLGALGEAVEAGLASGEEAFEELCAATGEGPRRAMDRLFAVRAALERGDGETLRCLEHIRGGDEEARAEYERKNGPRIWKHYRKEGRRE